MRLALADRPSWTSENPLLSPFLRCDIVIVAGGNEVLLVEDALIADVAEELLVMLVHGARAESDPTVHAADAPVVIRFAITGDDLRDILACIVRREGPFYPALVSHLLHLVDGLSTCGTTWSLGSSPPHGAQAKRRCSKVTVKAPTEARC